ncbi:MAG: glucuronate isomerase [Thermoguttaceae bacterium]|nr:glucuronate isomerase [Thermoguttaceae bacterium]
MIPFIHDDFLLTTKPARRLYHEYAADMPIIDYHCHLPVREIAEDRRFENLTQIWLAGDHYKWRAMRAAGVDEEFITGNASDYDKFLRWAETAPQTLRNPLFHWTALELHRPFGIADRLLCPATAPEIWRRCNTLLEKPEFSARGIMKQMNVRVVCTTDDPASDLTDHEKLAAEYQNGAFPIRVLPAFRPDAAMPSACAAPEGLALYRGYLERLGDAAGAPIGSLADLLSALAARQERFHAAGCRLADHGFGTFRYTQAPDADPEKAFAKILAGDSLSDGEILALESTILFETARRYAEKGWCMQLHIGALRNNSTRLLRRVGRDAGADSMADGEYMRALSAFLDSLETAGALPKTIVYNLNPASGYALAAMVANFNDGSVPGKMQYGSGWWFLDQYRGIREQIEILSTTGLLSRFVGMLTDSRSFLSYTRHEYFRRILCQILGEDIQSGFIPNDLEAVGAMVRGICYDNARDYFAF